MDFPWQDNTLNNVERWRSMVTDRCHACLLEVNPNLTTLDRIIDMDFPQHDELGAFKNQQPPGSDTGARAKDTASFLATATLTGDAGQGGGGNQKETLGAAGGRDEGQDVTVVYQDPAGDPDLTIRSGPLATSTATLPKNSAQLAAVVDQDTQQEQPVQQPQQQQQAAQ